MFKGYKTFIVAAMAILAGVLGKHIAPDVLANYADVMIAGLGVTFAALRVATTTPVFQVVAQDLGLSPAFTAAIQGTVASLDPDAKETISAAVADVNSAVGKLTGHPLFQPAAIDAMATLASLLPSLVTSAAAEPAKVEPAPVTTAQAPQAVPQPLTPDPAPVVQIQSQPAAPAVQQQ